MGAHVGALLPHHHGQQKDPINALPHTLPMPKNTNDQKRRVLWLRRTHTPAAIAAEMGLPLGTVKSITSRAGARENQRQREFFQLPPPMASTSTAIGVPKPLPPQSCPTGHTEIDAVLWLREVIDTGEPEHIERALEAAKRITTPAKELELLYATVLQATTGNTFMAALSSMGFADLEGRAKRVIERERRKRDAVARFGGSIDGEAVFAKTPQEQFCIDVLMFVPTIEKPWQRYDPDMAAAAFESEGDHAPHTLSDCIRELQYWDDLYGCRSAWENSGDHWPEVQAREDYLRWCMCRLRPVDKVEAVAVLDWAIERDALGWSEGPALLRNLVLNS